MISQNLELIVDELALKLIESPDKLRNCPPLIKTISVGGQKGVVVIANSSWNAPVNAPF